MSTGEGRDTERENEGGVGELLESAAIKARQKCAQFVSSKKAVVRHTASLSTHTVPRTLSLPLTPTLACPQSHGEKVSFIPKVEAKVRHKWYTRRDQDGQTVLAKRAATGPQEVESASADYNVACGQGVRASGYGGHLAAARVGQRAGGDASAVHGDGVG